MNNGFFLLFPPDQNTPTLFLVVARNSYRRNYFTGNQLQELNFISRTTCGTKNRLQLLATFKYVLKSTFRNMIYLYCFPSWVQKILRFFLSVDSAQYYSTINKKDFRTLHKLITSITMCLLHFKSRHDFMEMEQKAFEAHEKHYIDPLTDPSGSLQRNFLIPLFHCQLYNIPDGIE